MKFFIQILLIFLLHGCVVKVVDSNRGGGSTPTGKSSDSAVGAPAGTRPSPLQAKPSLLKPRRVFRQAGERSYQYCQERLKRVAMPSAASINGRSATFILKAKNKRYAQGGFTGPGAACVEVRHEFQPGIIFGYILVVYRNGTQLEFPGFNRIVSQGFQNLGNVGSYQTLRLRNANVNLTITNPPSVYGINPGTAR